ncbi:protein OXIDATIVE STRESS 3 LIKE 2 [Ricinus communis]|uniref:MTD1 n=1 Tax=Ricinus communis TaxID=3988 RepID=B9RQX8_RICCO|nr:protein OXIDATIVE STRESS 3 LIKE 2 [Ricinus communis]EEF46149.1 conserved hypothetical protein [Ricinus communis]|eukprot:XP_002516147.1 uncharacterized protein LOC8258594 [Ricinus communis]
MSITLECNSNRGMREIEPRGIVCVATARIFESPVAEERAEVNECSSSSEAASSTTSSIGKNSDLSSNGENCEDENEVQSAFKGTLDAMDALEEALSMRRGISKFYNGKSKSFTSLAEASSSSCIKEITKPENAYTRRRRNLLAFNHVWDKNRSFPHRSNGGGISKRPISSSKSTLALAVAMSSSESISSASEDSTSSSMSNTPTHLPPLHPRSRTYHNNLASLPSPRQNFSPWRSFSVADLQQCATTSDKTDTDLKYNVTRV